MNARTRTGITLCAAFVAIAGCGGSPPPAVKPRPSDVAALPPDEALRRIEEAMAAAKTISIRCRCEQIVRNFKRDEDRFIVDGTALLKEEGKVHLVLKGSDSQGEARGVSLDSDGSRVRYRLGFVTPAQECAMPKSFRGTVQGLLGRVGLAFSALIVANRLQADEARMDLSGAPPVSDFAKGEEDATSASFSYRLAAPGGKAMAAKLWYEKGTLRPLKRIVTREEGDQSLSFVETYAEYLLGPAPQNVDSARPAGEPAKPRRMEVDSAGWTLLVEKFSGAVVLILLAAPGATVTEEGLALQLKRGSTTIDLSGNRGMVLSGKGGFSAIAIPEGWTRDLVEEYRKHKASHADAAIRPWLQEELRRTPAPSLEQFVQKE